MFQCVQIIWLTDEVEVMGQSIILEFKRLLHDCYFAQSAGAVEYTVCTSAEG